MVLASMQTSVCHVMFIVSHAKMTITAYEDDQQINETIDMSSAFITNIFIINIEMVPIVP